MAAKDKLRELVEGLSEAEAAAKLKSLSARRRGLVALMDAAPVDDEALTTMDEAALGESYDGLATGGQVLSVEEFRRQRW